MSAFASAAAALHADANLGTAAMWRARDDGPPVSVRVIRDVPDATAAAFGTSVLSGTDVLEVTAAAVAEPQPGDTFTIGSEVLTVQHAERDMTGATWRLMCRRDA